MPLWFRAINVLLFLYCCFCSTVWQNSFYAGKLHQLHQGSISGGGFNTTNYSGTPNNNINHFGSIYIQTDNTLEVRNCACCSTPESLVSQRREKEPWSCCVNKPFIFNRVGWVSRSILQLGTHGRWCRQTPRRILTARKKPCTQAGQQRGQTFFHSLTVFQLAKFPSARSRWAKGRLHSHHPK